MPICNADHESAADGGGRELDAGAGVSIGGGASTPTRVLKAVSGALLCIGVMEPCTKISAFDVVRYAKWILAYI